MLTFIQIFIHLITTESAIDSQLYVNVHSNIYFPKVITEAATPVSRVNLYQQ